MESSNSFRPQLESLGDRLPPSSIHSAHSDTTDTTTDTTAAHLRTIGGGITKPNHNDHGGHGWGLPT